MAWTRRLRERSISVGVCSVGHWKDNTRAEIQRSVSFLVSLQIQLLLHRNTVFELAFAAHSQIDLNAHCLAPSSSTTPLPKPLVGAASSLRDPPVNRWMPLKTARHLNLSSEYMALPGNVRLTDQVVKTQIKRIVQASVGIETQNPQSLHYKAQCIAKCDCNTLCNALPKCFQ